MEITKMKAELFCIECNEDTVHEIVYIGDHIDIITCKKCNTCLEIDEKMALTEYTLDIFKRVFSKPERMSKEMSKDLSEFLKTIPFRIVTKPYRMIKEFKEVKKIASNKDE